MLTALTIGAGIKHLFSETVIKALQNAKKDGVVSVSDTKRKTGTRARRNRQRWNLSGGWRLLI